MDGSPHALPIKPNAPANPCVLGGQFPDAERATRAGESCSLLLSRFCETQEEWNRRKTGSGALGIPGAGDRTGL